MLPRQHRTVVEFGSLAQRAIVAWRVALADRVGAEQFGPRPRPVVRDTFNLGNGGMTQAEERTYFGLCKLLTPPWMTDHFSLAFVGLWNRSGFCWIHGLDEASGWLCREFLSPKS